MWSFFFEFMVYFFLLIFDFFFPIEVSFCCLRFLIFVWKDLCPFYLIVFGWGAYDFVLSYFD